MCGAKKKKTATRKEKATVPDGLANRNRLTGGHEEMKQQESHRRSETTNRCGYRYKEERKNRHDVGRDSDL
jgi:hypothetical protein